MSDSPAENTDTTSGTGDSDNNTDVNTVTQTDGVDSTSGTGDDRVPKSELTHALNDLHKFKSQAREAQDKLKQIEENNLKNSQEWEKYAKLKEDEADTFKQKFEGLQDNLVRSEKYSALKEAALKAGVRKEALPDLELVGFDEMVIETTNTGRMRVLGADSVVQKLKQDRPHWFRSGASNINPNMPEVVNGSSNQVTYDQLKKLEVEAKKTGDYAAYQKAIIEFKKQRG
jgi:hypothetical protein